jgi:hypothetical protein
MKRRTTVPAHFDRHDLDSDGFTSPLARAAGTTLARAIHGAAADANDVCLDLAIPARDVQVAPPPHHHNP